MRTLSKNQKEFIEYLITTNEVYKVKKDIEALKKSMTDKLNNIPLFDIERRKTYKNFIEDYDNSLSYIRDCKLEKLLYT